MTYHKRTLDDFLLPRLDVENEEFEAEFRIEIDGEPVIEALDPYSNAPEMASRWMEIASEHFIQV